MTAYWGGGRNLRGMLLYPCRLILPSSGSSRLVSALCFQLSVHQRCPDLMLCGQLLIEKQVKVDNKAPFIVGTISLGWMLFLLEALCPLFVWCRIRMTSSQSLTDGMRLTRLNLLT